MPAEPTRTSGSAWFCITSDQAEPAVFHLHGELDIDTAGVLAELPITIDRDRPVVLDLSDLTLCDTIGLSGLLTVRGRVVAERGDLVLRRPTPTVRSLLEITKLTPVLPIVD